INTIYELNKKYGWSKFIIVVPSIAIREGVNSALEDMKPHFKELYGKNLVSFIFDSQKINPVINFAKDDDINVMIINNQAFNSDVRKIHDSEKKSETGIAPIEYLKTTNPIMIIDEPQTTEGARDDNQTRKYIQEFNPLFILRYSATHREKYTMLYKLDAVDAFNRKLVKKIEVNGIEVSGSTATHGYFFVKEIIISKGAPKARIEIEKSTTKKSTHIMSEKDNVFVKYSQLEEYNGWVIDKIDAIKKCVIVRTSTGDKTFFEGKKEGDSTSYYKRRAQIQKTIESHLEKEFINYPEGIKTLSLFFIDEVKKYRDYDVEDTQGEYAKIFVEEYNKLVKEFVKKNPHMKEYYDKIDVNKTHLGYFSIDKTGKLVDPKESGRGAEKSCNDVDAFEEIMKNKKGLLDVENNFTRFIFSHSALKEGWDNPNVFQICILRDSDTIDLKLRQEVGRGLRLCVNKNYDRIDNSFQGLDSNKINILTLIANNSYGETATALQDQFRKNLRNRPIEFTETFLLSQKIGGKNVTPELAKIIHNDFSKRDYIDLKDTFTQKFKDDLDSGKFVLDDLLKSNVEEIKTIAQKLLNNTIEIKNGDKQKQTAKLNKNKINCESFNKIWDHIKTKSYYTVKFDSKELIKKSVAKLNVELKVNPIYLESIKKILKDHIENNNFEFEGKEDSITIEQVFDYVSKDSRFDLIHKLVDKTRLTKGTIIDILTKLDDGRFDLFKQNPEEFIDNVARIVNLEKAKLIIANIEYHKSEDKLSKSIFKEVISMNPDKFIETPNNHIYDKLEYDSKDPEMFIGEWADKFTDLKVFAKLPKNEYNIATPLENFSPDWLMVFDDKKVTYAYCIFESKATNLSDDPKRRNIENIKISCARKHFQAISNNKIKFEVVNSTDTILSEVGIKS
ncbi:MAG: DEAD/DEAH box helicase family protein, partial [Candidatus Nanoarchaeia archaeon]|nr:DEAD/DEAH box helicase family protein [Candidatus Nanoarchaeia archaeon]